MRLQRDRVHREGKRLFKFMVVGAIGAVVDFGSFNLLNRVFHVGSISASTVSFIAAVTSNFIWNRRWTYPDSRSKSLIRQATQFFLINLIGWIIRTPVFILTEQPWIRFTNQILFPFSERLGSAGSVLTSISPVAIGRNLALATAVVVVMFWNFGANRIWTYSDVK